MKLPEFCVKKPIFTLIMNIFIILAGLLSLNSLIVREYPNVDAAKITVETNYPNASMDVIEQEVTTPLEDALAGLEGLESIHSYSKSDRSTIKLQFKPGKSIDAILVKIQSAIQSAMAHLPREVKTPTITTNIQSTGIPDIALGVRSSSLSGAELTHYTKLYLLNQFRGLDGIARASVWGPQYRMQINLDDKRLLAHKVNVSEIYDVLSQHKAILPAGKFDQTIPVSLIENIKSQEELQQIVIKQASSQNSNGLQKSVIRLGDVADVFLSSDEENIKVRINGQDAVMIDLELASDANPLEVSKAVKEKVKNIQSILSQDIIIAVDIDKADFINESLYNIFTTILEAIFLVIIITILFLRTFSQGLIPVFSIPVSLIGSLFFINYFGLSINVLTMLAMVLGIGLVVDDSIVVLENVYRYREQGMDKWQAAIKGSREIGFAVVAMTLTLISVYIPIVFLNDPAVVLFKEFAITLACAVLISGVVSLTLTPLLCAWIPDGKHIKLFDKFDLILQKSQSWYVQKLKQFISRQYLFILAIAVLLTGSAILYSILPHQQAPKEDRNLLGVYFPIVPGKKVNFLTTYAQQVDDFIGNHPAIKNRLFFMGDWGASYCLVLKPHKERSISAFVLKDKLEEFVRGFSSIEAFTWAYDNGLPNVDTKTEKESLKFYLLTSRNYDELNMVIRNLLENKTRFGLEELTTDLSFSNIGMDLSIDRLRLEKLGMKMSDIQKTLRFAFSETEIMDIFKDTLKYPAYMALHPKARNLDDIFTFNNEEQPIYLSSVMTMKKTSHPPELKHIGQLRAASLSVPLNANLSVEQGVKKLYKLWEILPKTVKPSWSKGTLQLMGSNQTMLILFLLAIVFIYGILAVQFESWLDPLLILTTVPLATFGGLFVLWAFNQSLNIYSMIGLVTLIALITKHGILIIEFANSYLDKSKDIVAAALHASSVRFRPIMMTSVSTLLGILPLVLSGGAGAEARRSIGGVLLGGICIGTFLTLFVIPTCFIIIKRFLEFNSRAS